MNLHERRRMKDSYIESYLPFAQNQALKEEYIDGYGGLRNGRLMEDMDALAGLVAYKHCVPVFEQKLSEFIKHSCQGEDRHNRIVSPRRLLTKVTSSIEMGAQGKVIVTIVTASVDGIHFLKPLSVDYDIRLSGFVSYVGKSSMEVVLRLESYRSLSNYDLIALACFTMVARDPVHYNAVQVPGLELVTDAEKAAFTAAEQRRIRRRGIVEQSLLKTNPLLSENEHIHQLYLQSQSKPNQLTSDAIGTLSYMSDNVLSSTKIVYPQDRNIHFFLFGGALMRDAYELAFASACMYFGTCLGVSFVSLDETTFKAPIPIGSILNFTSQIIYVGGDVEMTKAINRRHSHSHPKRQGSTVCQVQVHVELLNQVDKSASHHHHIPTIKGKGYTNIFYFNFECITESKMTLLPKTYEEIVAYLEGKRRLERLGLVDSKEDFDSWCQWITEILDKA